MSVHDPLTRDGLARLAADCSLLLDYLSRTPDTRLDWCFQETRSQMSGVPPARLARPPADARTKEHFLQKLINIAQKVQKADCTTFPLKPDEVAFLLTSRDFLSAIAWPATVESIRVTEAYNAERRRSQTSVLWAKVKALVPKWRSGAPHATDTLTDLHHDERAVFYGRKIARRRNAYQYFLIILAALTVWLSFETLAGQRLVREAQKFEGEWRRHDAAVHEASEKAMGLLRATQRPDPSVELSQGFYRYCDYVENGVIPTIMTQSGGGSGGGRTMTVSADDSFTGGAGAQAPRPRDYFLDFNHQQLCDERETLRSQADSLRRVMQRWFTDISPVMGLLRFPADFYAELHGGICWGMLRATGREQSRLAQHVQEEREASQAGRPPPRAPCTTGPQRAEQGRHVNAAALPPGSETYYWAVGTEVVTAAMLAQLLPCFYAVLGALASMFRRLGQLVETEALSVAYYGAMRMTVILGILAGAVIGLFVAQVQALDSSATLTLAGFALLAGYAVDRLFTLFDALAARFFGEAPTAPTSAR